MTNEEFDGELELLFIRTSLSSLLILIGMTFMFPFFDVNPDFFKNDELEEARKAQKYYCGRFGYKIYEYLSEIKDETIKLAEDYLAIKKQKSIKVEP